MSTLCRYTLSGVSYARRRALRGLRGRVVAPLHRLRVRTWLKPQSTDAVPRPQRRQRNEKPLRLETALVASDLTPRYLDLWPLARKAWREIVGLDATLVLVAEHSKVPAALLSDPDVHVYEPAEHLHPAFQAQCIRLLYPALMETDGAVVTSDVDMLPLSADYFRRSAARVRARDFIAYRDVLLGISQIPICYNAALPATWAELFAVRSIDDVRARLDSWADGVAYDGVRGGRGWDTDQLVLHRAVVDWGAQTRRAWILDDRTTGFRRLERAELRKPRSLDTAQSALLRRGAFTDYHALPPSDGELAELNDEILRIACSAANA